MIASVVQHRCRMPKQILQDSKIVLGSISSSTPMVSFLVAGVGLSFLVAEGAVLSAKGVQGIAYALTAIFIASTVSSIAGFAFSALSGALLFHLIDDQVYVVRVMIVCSIAIQLLSVATLWRTIDWRNLGVFLIGGLLGVAAGVYLLLNLPGTTYRGVIGTLLIGYGCYVLLRPRVRTLQLGAVSDICAGFLGGITGGLAGFPGCFVTIWCGLKGWDKARQRGVYQPFILFMQPVTLFAIHLMRGPSRATAQFDWKVYVFIPAALLGAWFGLGIFKRLSDRHFELVVNVLLIASGFGLVL
ncbi:MAG: sulfite exporter TauE/SafE family protein [Bradyrhizobium icense]|nr:MAG: sulfite exporter TauE/SafE family protein [Bradyrhizobium icense]